MLMDIAITEEEEEEGFEVYESLTKFRESWGKVG